jgi:oxalate decarboxylase
MTTPSPHVAALAGAAPVFQSELGSIEQLTAESFPILKRLSIKRILLEPGALREPQWNVNANQLAYVVSGTVLVSMLGNADAFSSFVVGAGQMYHVESGAVYHIENVGDEPAEIIAALRASRPRHFSLQSSFSAMTDAVLGNTYDLPTRPGCPTRDCSTWRGSSPLSRTPTAARSSPGSSTGRRWRTCRCTRSSSGGPACASRTGIR